jgi:hypothetical protein
MPARPSRSTAMTYLDPNPLLPQYETNNDELRACWPGLVAIARTKSSAKHDVFHELSPLPGGFFLAGVGEATDGSDLREKVLAHLMAGADLKEALRIALRSDATCALRASACYVHFDPLEATMRIESAGQHVSAIYFISGSGGLLRTGTRFESGTPVTLALRPGEALALIAHPRAWEKHVLSAVHHALPEDGVTLTEAELQDLCAVLDDVAGPSARLLLYRQDAAGTSDGGRRKDSLVPAGELDPIWTPEDFEFLDRMACSPV